VGWTIRTLMGLYIDIEASIVLYYYIFFTGVYVNKKLYAKPGTCPEEVEFGVR
jgi:hypothetical protein